MAVVASMNMPKSVHAVWQPAALWRWHATCTEPASRAIVNVSLPRSRLSPVTPISFVSERNRNRGSCLASTGGWATGSSRVLLWRNDSTRISALRRPARRSGQHPRKSQDKPIRADVDHECQSACLPRALDPHVPIAHVTAFNDEMNSARADWRLIVYGGAMHGFTDENAAGYNTPGVGYDALADAAPRRRWSNF